jgi:hypothetical protein
MQTPHHLGHHDLIFAVFLISGVILFANVVHWIAFTIIRRRKELSGTEIHVPLNISKHLSHPAR